MCKFIKNKKEKKNHYIKTGERGEVSVNCVLCFLFIKLVFT